MKRKLFRFVEPGQIMSVVVCLILIGVGVFAVFTITSNTTSSIPGSTASSWTLTEDFQTDTAGTDPSGSFYTYTDVNWTAGVNSTGTLKYWNVTDVDSPGSGANKYNYSNFEFDVASSLIPYSYRTISFNFQQDATRNNQTDIHIEDINGADYAKLEINYSYIAVSIGGTERWNQTIDTLDQHRFQMNFTLATGSAYTISTVRALLYNGSGLCNISTAITAPTTTRQGFLNITGADTAKNASLMVDNITLAGITPATINVTDVGTTTEAVFAIVGVVLIIAGIMAIVAIVKRFA